MLGEPERQAIQRLWARKKEQDASGTPFSERHRNLHPSSAEFICGLAAGAQATRLLEIGGSSGISTIALATAARVTGGRLVSIECEPRRQSESRETIEGLDLSDQVEFILGDAGEILPSVGEKDFVLIDCEKEDYIRFFDLLEVGSGGIVVADNILSHDLSEYVRHVRSRDGLESVTVPVGKGLELTRYS